MQFTRMAVTQSLTVTSLKKETVHAAVTPLQSIDADTNAAQAAFCHVNRHVDLDAGGHFPNALLECVVHKLFEQCFVHGK